MAKKRKRKATVSPEQPPISDDKWRRRYDYEKLIDAAEVSRDPARMRGVRAHAKEQRERADRISRLQGKLL